MRFPSWRCGVRRVCTSLSGRRPTPPSPRLRWPWTRLEELEARLAPASFAVSAGLEITRLDADSGVPVSARAVVFFESSVADLRVLRQGLAAGTDAVVLDSTGDGLRQMATFLAGRNDLTSLGIVAHGSPGELMLGSTTLSAANLGQYAQNLAAIGGTLIAGGEVDLWSCGVAAGISGAALVHGLAAATGAGVAASDVAIGDPALGGAWQLDVHVGQARADVPFNGAAIAAFHEVLGETAGAWNSGASMFAARDFQTATLLNNGQVLVAGGLSGNSTLASAELYDPATNSWSPAGSLASPRARDTATLLGNGQVLVTGGGTGSEGATAELYDPVSNSWSSAGSMAVPRAFQTATLLGNGKVLVTGGVNPTVSQNSYLASAEVYDPITNTWSMAASMATARASQTATLLPNGQVLVTGGSQQGNTILASAELYNPVTNTWSSAGSMAIPRTSHTATLLGNGKVLIAGGGGTEAELYDPVTNTWSDGGTMAAARFNQTATLLGNGKVLVAGGGAFLASAEVYDPVSNTWSSAGSMATGRRLQTATLLGTGKVLLAGGTNSLTNQALASTEIYDPAGADPVQSTVKAQPTNLPIGGTATLTLTARDAAGNQETRGGMSFSFGLGSGAGGGTFTNLTDNNDGTYTAVFKATAAGSITITATLNGQAITSTLPTFTITAALPTVSVADTGGGYNGSPYAVTAASVVGTNSETLASLGSPSLSYQYYVGPTASGTAATTAPTNAGTYTVVAHWTSDNANYASADSAPVTFTITPAALTVTADTKSKTYGATDPTFTFQITSGALVAGDAFKGTLGRVAGENVGSYAIQQGTLTPGGNYTITFVGANLNVTPRSVTVTADAKSKNYGDPDPALTFQITSGSLVSGDAFTGTLTRVLGENVGTYALQLGTLGLSNDYTLSFIGNNLVINQRALTVVADAKSKPFGAADPTLTFQVTIGSLAPGDAFTGALTRTPGESVGSYAIQLGTLALNGNYALSFVGNSVTIAQRAITVAADAKTKQLGAADPPLTYQITAGSLLPGDAFTGALTRTAGESVGSYAIQQGTLALGSNYALSFIGNNLTISQRTITVTADAKTKIYGASDPALTFQITSGALMPGDSFTGSLGRTPGESVGTYTIGQGTLSLGSSYALTIVGANLAITPRPITVTADGKTKSYGAADPALSYVVTAGSLLSGDTFSGTLTRAPGESVGAYAIQQGALALNANYTLTYVGNSLTINPRPITVTATARGKVYGDPDPALPYQITSGSLLSGDAFTGALLRVPGETVGSYPIQQGALALNSNYAITYVGANLTITQRPITVTADSKSKSFGAADPALTYQITAGSLVPGDALAGALTRAPGESVGSYTIQQGTLALNSNYALSFVGSTLTVNARALTITADAKSKSYGDPDPALTFQITAGALLPGDMITGSLKRTAGEDVGSYAIQFGTLSLPGNYAVTYIGANLSIGQRAVTVNADAKSKPLGAADPALTYQLTSGLLAAGDSFSGALARAPGETVGGYAIQQGTLALSNNYALSFVGATLTITPATQFAIGSFSTTSTTAGAAVTFAVTAQDGTGRAVPGYVGTVQLSSSDTRASINGSPAPASYTFTTADAGSHTFTVIFQTPGTPTVAVSDTVNHFTATSSPVAVAVTFSKYAVSVVGGSPVAGNAFLVNVQATDQFGNAVSNYAGPSTFDIASTPVDALGNLPATGSLNSLGNGVVLVTLKTAGAYTLTATAGGFSGTSASLTVAPAAASYFKVTGPATPVTTGSPASVTVTAVDLFGNVAAGYTGTVHFTSTDPKAVLPADASLAKGVGIFSVTLNTAGSQSITATDTSHALPIITGTSAAISARGLSVTSLTPTASGFTVTFSKPIVASDISLYGGTQANPIQDVTLVGKNTAAVFGAVNGILLIDPSGASATFKASSDWLQNVAGQTNGVLPDDIWTVNLQSGVGAGSTAHGFFDALGTPLDGANDDGHANFATSFTTANDGKPTLGIPDFARGPDSFTTIKVPNNSAKGIPVTLAAAPAGTKDVVFTLNYNPALLSVTGAGTGDSSGTGSTFTIGTPANGAVTFTWHNSTGLTGDLVLGDILANVPNSAANLYRAKELLTLTTIKVNGGAFTGVASPAVHVNAYFGDSSGDGQITGLDLATATNVAAGTPTSSLGLAAYKLVDPGLIGDIAGDGSIDAGALSSLASYLVHTNPLTIPTPPVGLTIAPGGPDPVLSLGPVGRVANPSYAGVINVPVLLDHAQPDGSTGMTEAIIALTYDPKALSLTADDITLGSLPASGSGWRLESVVDAATGQIAIDLYSTTALTQAQAGSLVNIAFHAVPGAYVPAAAVQLVNAVTPQGRWFSTEVVDAENKFVLSPGVDRLLIQTGVPVAMAVTTAVSAPISVERGQIALDAEKGIVSLASAETHDGLVVMSSGSLAGELSATVPANMVVVTGALAFQQNAWSLAVSQVTNQIVQIGNLPLINALVNGLTSQPWMNSLFQAVAQGTDAWANQAQNDFLDAVPGSKDWFSPSSLTANAATATDLSHAGPESAGAQDAVTDRIAVLDEVFGRLREDADSFGDWD